MPEPSLDGARLADTRRCDFAEALAALHELLGARVAVSVGADAEAGLPIRFEGTLLGARELGRGTESPLAFKVGEAFVLLSPAHYLAGWREEYERRLDGARWRLVAVSLRGGLGLEVEELLEEA